MQSYRSAIVASIHRGLYWGGIVLFLTGLALEVYGFYLRVVITGWAPVTNMYETVIFVAAVSSILGLVLEAVYRRTFAALAGAMIATVCTALAATVPLLDPSIKTLPPVLRSNLWLTIHVLTIVSSYAAFALAMGLGMIATGYYLTATYRRSPGFGELLAPAGIGLPLLVLGIAAPRGVVRRDLDRPVGGRPRLLAGGGAHLLRDGLHDRRRDRGARRVHQPPVPRPRALPPSRVHVGPAGPRGRRPRAGRRGRADAASRRRLGRARREGPPARGNAATTAATDQAAGQLRLSRHAGRRPARRRRHDLGRRLGRLLVGPVLGLGREGGLGAHHACSSTSSRSTAGSPAGSTRSAWSWRRWSASSRCSWPGTA